MAIDRDRILQLIGAAGRLVGIKELLRAGGLNPGVQTELKRALREWVKEGVLERDGKRFGLAGAHHERRAGPAWEGASAPAGRAGPKADRRPAPARAAPTGPARLRGLPPPRLVRAPGQPPSQPEAPKKGPPRTRPTHGPLVTGIIHHHADGFAFVKPIVGQVSEDLFIPPEEARKALDHDQVTVEVVPGRGGKTMGRVVEVNSRTRQLVVGVYRENARGAWVEPREAELGLVRVPPTQLARPGDAVKVRLGVGDSLFVDRGQLTGEVAGSLGSNDDHSVEVLSIAYARGFHDEFPPEVMDEADQIPVEVSEKDATAPKRRDLRQLPLITIDGEDARDFDDAIYVEAHPKGHRLVVAIADVAHYVVEHSALDAEALRRATSVYLPGRVLPMLPERLSNGICSLRPDVDRLCMVADLVIDKGGATIETDLYPAVMRSHARCTYTEVHQVLAGEDVPGRTPLKPLFERANALAKTLTRMRLERGAIDFDLPENRVVLDQQGLPTHLAQRERWESHRLVEECMLAANEAVARFFREHGAPTVNRYHGEPDDEKLGTFLNLLKAYGIEVKGELTSKELNRVLAQLVGHPEQRALHQLALRSMMQAVYSSEQSGHYGLGAEDYLHFTSPIRRYPDLLVHRLLKAFWGRRKTSPKNVEAQSDRLEALAVQCSERERAAMQVEREVNALYACLLMKDRVGEAFAATIGGLSEHGFFVVLDEEHVEGFVKGESVFPDFELDPATYRLVFGSGQQVRVGQKLKVTLVGVNLQKKQMEFMPLELEGFSRLGAGRRHQAAEPRGRQRPASSGGGPRERVVSAGKRPGDRFERSTPRKGSRGESFGRDKADRSGAKGKPRGQGGAGGGRGATSKGRFARSEEPAGGGRFDRTGARRSPQPPAGPWSPQPSQPTARSARTEPASTTGEERPQTFDARAVLDRLWRERGGGKGR